MKGAGNPVKIVVGADERTVSAYFGKSQHFIIFDVAGGRIVGEERIENPGHTRRFSPPRYVANLGGVVVIGGVIGRIAFNIMRKRGMEVIAGASGDADAAVVAYLEGKLALDESAIETRDASESPEAVE